MTTTNSKTLSKIRISPAGYRAKSELDRISAALGSGDMPPQLRLPKLNGEERGAGPGRD